MRPPAAASRKGRGSTPGSELTDGARSSAATPVPHTDAPSQVFASPSVASGSASSLSLSSSSSSPNAPRVARMQDAEPNTPMPPSPLQGLPGKPRMLHGL